MTFTFLFAVRIFLFPHLLFAELCNTSKTENEVLHLLGTMQQLLSEKNLANLKVLFSGRDGLGRWSQLMRMCKTRFLFCAAVEAGVLTMEAGVRVTSILATALTFGDMAGRLLRCSDAEAALESVVEVALLPSLEKNPDHDSTAALATPPTSDLNSEGDTSSGMNRGALLKRRRRQQQAGTPPRPHQQSDTSKETNLANLNTLIFRLLSASLQGGECRTALKIMTIITPFFCNLTVNKTGAAQFLCAFWEFAAQFAAAIAKQETSEQPTTYDAIVLQLHSSAASVLKDIAEEPTAFLPQVKDSTSLWVEPIEDPASSTGSASLLTYRCLVAFDAIAAFLTLRGINPGAAIIEETSAAPSSYYSEVDLLFLRRLFDLLEGREALLSARFRSAALSLLVRLCSPPPAELLEAEQEGGGSRPRKTNKNRKSFLAALLCFQFTTSACAWVLPPAKEDHTALLPFLANTFSLLSASHAALNDATCDALAAAGKESVLHLHSQAAMSQHVALFQLAVLIALLVDGDSVLFEEVFPDDGESLMEVLRLAVALQGESAVLTVGTALVVRHALRSLKFAIKKTE